MAETAEAADINWLDVPDLSARHTDLILLVLPGDRTLCE
jgi:hypothetical protein